MAKKVHVPTPVEKVKTFTLANGAGGGQARVYRNYAPVSNDVWFQTTALNDEDFNAALQVARDKGDQACWDFIHSLRKNK